MKFHLNRTVVLLCFAGWAHAAESDPPPGQQIAFLDTPMTPAAIAKVILEKAGTQVDVSTLPDKPVTMGAKQLSFWQAVERLAEATDSRVVTTAGRISLKPGKSLSSSSLQGPFRFAARDVLIRGDPDTGKSNYTIVLDVTWESPVLAYRIDGVPKISMAKDESGKGIEISGGGSRVLTAGNSAELTVRPQGLSRANKSLSISGSVIITMADEMLTFTFDAANPKAVPSQKGIAVSVKKHGTDGADWFAVMGVESPKSNVSVESYEYALLRNNVVSLLRPKDTAIKANLVEAVDLRYGFKNMAKQVGPGWKLEYRTPGPLREIVVPFELKNISLP